MRSADASLIYFNITDFKFFETVAKNPKMSSKLARECMESFSNVHLKSLIYSKNAFDVILAFVNKFKFNTEFVEEMEKILKVTLKDMLVREKF